MAATTTSQPTSSPAREPLVLIANSSDFAKWEEEWVSWLFSDFEIEHVLDPDHTLVRDRAIVVLLGDLQGKDERIARYLQSFHDRALKVGVLHLSDEWGHSPTGFYAHADFVLRNYWRTGVTNTRNCHYFALGYKTGFPAAVTPKPITERRYVWCFAGHAKPTRAPMLQAAHQVAGGIVHETHAWNDPNALSTETYAQMLCDSVFALCPSGNQSPDTFRLYEALEAGCIPIVEEDGGWRAWSEAVCPASVLRIKPWQHNNWRRMARKATRRSYWDRAFGGAFPCPRLCHWQNLRSVIASIDIEKTAPATQAWWLNYKSDLRATFRSAVESCFAAALRPAHQLPSSPSDVSIVAQPAS
jgi:hypothetical protein